METSSVKKTLVIGSGSCAITAAQEINDNNCDIIMAVGQKKADTSFPLDDKKIAQEILFDARIVSCDGCFGDFDVVIDASGKRIKRNVASITIAEENRREPNYNLLDLTPSSSTISLTEVMGNKGDSIFFKGGKTVFMTSLVRESNPVILKGVMTAALLLASDYGQNVYILTGNLKVGDDHLEALYRETRKKGVIYIKLANGIPDITQDKKGKTTLLYHDDILHQQCKLTPDTTIVDETILPSDYLDDLSRVLRLHRDSEGFLQADNVHRIPVLTNRRGIFAAGPSRGVFSVADHLEDAKTVASMAVRYVKAGIPEPETWAEIERGGCVRCLTCYRVCPYRAVSLNSKPFISPQACEGCGLCMAECPNRVITMKGFDTDDMLDSVNEKPAGKGTEDFSPFIIAFCCSRSAKRAGELSKDMGLSLPDELKIIEVPCAGSISFNMIYSALKKGADGILVLTCHEGNCHSEVGNTYAHSRATIISHRLQNMGIEKERVTINTLASNMGKGFADTAEGFQAVIKELGPIGL